MNLEKILKMGCIKMNVKRVWLLCGIPASGKSYWATNFINRNPNTAYISRDEVRFSIIKDDEEYFSHEDEVFDIFVARINRAIDAKENENIIIDATHLNWNSRRKILNRLQETWNVTDVFFDTPLEVCLERNEKREGRARVPRGVIRRMYFQRTNPKTDPFPYKEVIEVK